MTAPSLEVTLRPDRAGTATPVIRIGAFDGPLALLLAVIEARRLDVLTVPLGDLAEAFLEALAHLEGDRLPSLSSFVEVAAQLILIKSRALLPRPLAPPPGEGLEEGFDPEEELRRRLVLYRAYRDAGRRLAERLAWPGLFHREAGVAAAAGLAGARPPQEPTLDPAALADALRGLARLLPPPELAPGRLVREITMEERAEAIRAALRAAPVIVLQELLRGVRDRVVAAVTFLAMLELVKRRELIVEQAEPWGPIVCRRPGEGGA
ncbi:MAG: hypothetical protein A2X23_05730 [Chloroflexi bacterium GWC2_73_18]|nr:MAG: hypothetical protein A2X23_05730 [Chloroflexi bacterium GWC2_73_18]